MYKFRGQQNDISKKENFMEKRMFFLFAGAEKKLRRFPEIHEYNLRNIFHSDFFKLGFS